MPVPVVVHLSCHFIAVLLCLSDNQHPAHSAQCMLTANAVSMAMNLLPQEDRGLLAGLVPNTVVPAAVSIHILWALWH